MFCGFVQRVLSPTSAAEPVEAESVRLGAMLWSRESPVPLVVYASSDISEAQLPELAGVT